MTWKKVVNSDVGDADHFGGDDLDKVSDLFSGVSGVDTIDMNSNFTFRDQRMKQKNPANTQTLTWMNPAILASQNHWMLEPYRYIVFKDGSTYYCQSGITGGVESSNADASVPLHYAISNAAGVGKVLIKAGTYVCDTAGTGSKPSQILTLYDNTHIEGEGKYNTILQSTSNSATLNFFTNDDTTNGNSKIVLNNFQIDHVLSNNKNTIGLSPVKDMTLTNMYLKNGATAHFNMYVSGRRDVNGLPDYWVDNFYMDGCLLESHNSCSWDNMSGGLIRNSVIANCVFGPSGGSAGMAQRLMENTTVTNCVSYDSDSSGFSMEAGLKNTFSNCIAHDTLTSGFKCLHVSTGGPPVDGFPIKMKYNNCMAWNNVRGFELEGPYHEVIGCTAYDNAALGIDLNGDYGLITGNHVFHNGTNTGNSNTNRGGIKLSYTAHSGWTYAGKNVVSGNYCFDDNGTPTQTYGINEAATTVNNNFIHGNHCWGNTLSPVLVSGAATTAGLNYLTDKYTQTAPLSFTSYQELAAMSAPSSPSTGFTRVYCKTIDSNNDGLFVKRRLNGAVVEVQVG